MNLGHYTSPAGNRNTQATKLKEKAKTLTDNIIRCNLSRNETRMVFQTVWNPSIRFSLGQSFLSDKQLDSIEKASLPKIYAASGYNRNTKKVNLQAPSELSGGSFTPLHVTASASYVLHFIRNWRSKTEKLGKVIRICYAWAAANAGVFFPLFEFPDTNIPHLRGTVIPAIQRFLSSIDATIHLDNKMIRPKLREYDIFLMDVAIKMFFTKSKLEQIKAVREYLNIIFLSEISEPNGTTIAKGVLYGNSGDNWYRRRTAGPKQSKPNTTNCNCWRRLIATLLGSGLSLRRPLGLWTKHHSTHGFWKAYLSSEFFTKFS